MLGDRTQLTQAPWPAMHVQNRNSVAYRLALVADGSADASVSLTAKRDWDLAAADIILHEAGGRLTDAGGAALIYNRPVTKQASLVAANPRLQQQAIRLNARASATKRELSRRARLRLNGRTQQVEASWPNPSSFCISCSAAS